ncbi:high affinity immunoglobulin gamma Fc receptor I-like isoform X4 [Epinephelus lanceolatus]
MEVTALCFRLLMLEFIQIDASFLHITPDRLQHFEYESVSFNCVEISGPTHLRGVSNTQEFNPVCHIKRTPSGSSCTIDKIYPADSGEYWCETEGGERSNSVNISVTVDGVILESPALPVMEGKAVTLRCKNKTTSRNPSANFYKDGLLMGNSSTAELTINSVSKSDEGLYKCHISGVGESPDSWLAVRANTRSTISSPPHKDHLSNNSDIPHVPILLWIAITILILALVLVVVGFLYIRKHRAASHAVKDNQRDNASDDADDVTYTVVFTKPREDKDAVDTADNLSLRSNHTRKPRAEKQSGLSGSTVSLSPKAAKDSSTTEQKPIYTTVQKVKSRDA